MKAQLINQSQLLEILASIPAGQIVNLTTAKSPKMLKRGNPYLEDDVLEVANMRVMVNFDYGNSVNNRRAKAGLPTDFVPQDRAWGQHVDLKDHPKAKIVEHKGSFYLDGQVMTKPQKTYAVNGKETAKDDLKAWFPKRKPQEFAYLSVEDLEGMTDEQIEKWACENVQFRDYKFDSISKLTTQGKTYVVVENQPDIEPLPIELEEDLKPYPEENLIVI